MRQVFLKFNSTGMPSCLSVQWEPISSIGVAFRSSISVIAAITLITVSLQQNKCNCHVCPSVQRNKCYNAIFAKAPHWPHCHHWNFSTCQNLHFKGSEKVRWLMISVKKYDWTQNWFQSESDFFGQKSLTPAPGQTMVGFQSSFTGKSLMKSGLKSRLIVPESDF